MERHMDLPKFDDVIYYALGFHEAARRFGIDPGDIYFVPHLDACAGPCVVIADHGFACGTPKVPTKTVEQQWEDAVAWWNNPDHGQNSAVFTFFLTHVNRVALVLDMISARASLEHAKGLDTEIDTEIDAEIIDATGIDA